MPGLPTLPPYLKLYICIIVYTCKYVIKKGGNYTKRNARSLRLTGINYRADKWNVQENHRLHHTPYSKEEHGSMRVVEYMELTGLSRTRLSGTEGVPTGCFIWHHVHRKGKFEGVCEGLGRKESITLLLKKLIIGG